jgi:hypothetical protein
MNEPKDPIDEYDRVHGNPAATPDKPNISEADSWGEKLNPVRETPLAGANLKEVGK